MQVRDQQKYFVIKAWIDEKITKKFFRGSIVVIGLIFMTFHAAAGEVIIQKEKISFEKCLNVITISQDKLSVAPESTDIDFQKRIAVFTLVDGTLTIKCDGEDGNVTVSTNNN